MPGKVKIPQEESPGEAAFALHCRADKLNPVREHQFHPTRKWRFDFAFPDDMLAVEIEGGVNGRHHRFSGFAKDAEKYNAAALLGWRVLRFTTSMVMSGEAINTTRKALGLPDYE